MMNVLTLFILVGFVFSSKPPAILKSISTCPAELNQCGLFGCVRGECPLECTLIKSSEQCKSNRANGIGCVWYDNACHRDVVCVQASDLSCSIGCHPCEGYGCIPENDSCPARCNEYTSSNSCAKGKGVNGIQCRWDKTLSQCLFTPPLKNNPRFAAAVAGLADKAAQRSQQRALIGNNSMLNNPANEDDARRPDQNDGSGVSGKEAQQPFSPVWFKGSNGFRSAVIGVTVGGLALMGMALLAITSVRRRQKRRQDLLRATVDLPTERKRSSLLPFFRGALGINNNVGNSSSSSSSSISNNNQLRSAV